MTKKKNVIQYDVDTHRRFLAFLNAAQHPLDLIAPNIPPCNTILRTRIALAVNNLQPQRLIDEKLAQRIIDVRNERSPIIGFTHIEQIRDWFEIDIFDWWNNWICVFFGTARFGAWQRLNYDTCINVAQAALVHTPDDDHYGRVLLIEQVFGDGEINPSGHNLNEEDYSRTPLWKPQGTTQANAFEENAPHPPGLGPEVSHNYFEPSRGNLYCSAHSFLSDGSLLAVGGGGQYGQPPEIANMAWIFDPKIKEWHPTYNKSIGHGSFTEMSVGRWYPTAITLGDDAGRVLIVGGAGSESTTHMEVYNEHSGTFSTISGPAGEIPDPSQSPITWDYPNLHLQRNGEIFYSRAMRTGGVINGPARFSFTSHDAGRWSFIGGVAESSSARGSASAMLIGEVGEPDRVILVGGSTNEVRVIDVPASSSTPWQVALFPDGLSRNRANLVLLPDGTVLIAGGTTTGTECYLFDAAQMGGNPFTQVAGLNVQRTGTSGTHFQFLLLPDGRVATFGSNRVIEVFTPPYLYNSQCQLASRPEISDWPNPDQDHYIRHGQTFTVTSAQAEDIGRVVLVQPMSVTHQMDTAQRVLPLCFTYTGGDELNILVPDGRVYPYGSDSHTHAINPRGVYMLFIFDNQGVPSEAKFVRLQ